MDREKVINGLTRLSTLGVPDCAEESCPFWKVCIDGEGCYFDLFPFALALLKKQEEQKQKWLQNIADNQLANAPMDGCCLEQWNYQKGVYDGLQMAYNILTESQ